MKIPVDDPVDPRIEVFQGLRDHVLRQVREQPGGDMAGLFVSEGDVVVERALAAGYKLQSLLIDGKRTKPLPAVVPEDVPVYAAAPNVLQRITGYHLHRGVIACFQRKPLTPVAEVLKSGPTLFVVEAVGNPTNLGVMLRCAAGLGVDGFLLDPTCSDPLYRRCGRVSMGEAYSLPYSRLEAFPDGLAPVRDAGFTTLAFTPESTATDIGTLKLGANQPVALMFGSEGPGLTDKAQDSADQKVRIPMSSSVDSINVGSAAAVAFYAIQQARLG